MHGRSVGPGPPTLGRARLPARRVPSALMEALILEQAGEKPAPWLTELSDEFLEDPECRLVLMGSDDEGALLITIWEPETVSAVETGLRGILESGARLRRLSVLDPGNPVASP